MIADNLLLDLKGNEIDTRKYREVFSLTVRHGGLNIVLPKTSALQGGFRLLKDCLNPSACEQSQQLDLNQFKKDKSDNLKHEKEFIRLKLTDEELFSLDVASEKCASCWLNILPIKRYSFNITKSEFGDSIALWMGA